MPKKLIFRLWMTLCYIISIAGFGYLTYTIGKDQADIDLIRRLKGCEAFADSVWRVSHRPRTVFHKRNQSWTDSFVRRNHEEWLRDSVADYRETSDIQREWDSLGRGGDTAMGEGWEVQAEEESLRTQIH